MEETTARRTGGKRLLKEEPAAPSPRRGSWRIPAIAVGVLAVGYLGLCAYAASRDTFYPNTALNGLDVGGLTVDQAQQEIETSVPGRVLQLVDSAEGGAPLAEVTYEELGISAGMFAGEAQARMDEIRHGGFPVQGVTFLRALMGQFRSGETLPNPDETTFSSACERLAQQLYEPAANGAWDLEGQQLTITREKDGRSVDAAGLAAALRTAYESGADSASVTFATLPAVPITAQGVHDAVAGQMKNAGYDAKTKSITPEQVGADFDIPAAQAQLDAAAPGESVTVEAEIQYPHVTAQQLKGVLFRDVLGQCRTKVGGSGARISNVKLASSAFNGTVLNSGETFSYNGTVGQRTAAKGYQAAPAYVKGETVDEIGGGVCQPSSTLYFACLRANMAITERYAHRYAPSYIEWGMDATVSWNGPDYKFTNNTDYPVKITATYSGGYLTVQLLGTNTTGQHADMTHEVLSTTPWETVYEDDATLAPGTEKVKVTPYTGYKVVSYQHIYDANGKEISVHQEATSIYKVRNKVVLRGPALPAGGSAEVPTTPTNPSAGSSGKPETPATDPVTPQPDPAQPIDPPPTAEVDPPESGGGSYTVVDLFPDAGA